MPLLEKVFNTTLEKQEPQIHSKVYTMLPRTFCDVPEEIAPIIEAEHALKGLVVIRPGDDFKAKEREGLINYLSRLTERINNYQAWMDQKKLEGKTIEKPLAMTRAIRWREEISEMLNLEKPLVEELSFKNEEHRTTPNMFSEKPEIVVNPYEPVAKKRGRPAKSFKEAMSTEA